MTRGVALTRDEAVQRFDSGRPISVSASPEVSPLWTSKATSNYGARSFEDVESFAHSYSGFPDGAPLHYWRPQAGRRTSDETAGAIFRREAFEIGNMSGGKITVGKLGRLGALPPEYRVQLAEAVKAHVGPSSSMYMVYSFETPIAWEIGEVVTMPPVRYSITTTQHQHLAATALGVRMPVIEVSLMTRARRNPDAAPGWQTRKWGGQS